MIRGPLRKNKSHITGQVQKLILVLAAGAVLVFAKLCVELNLTLLAESHAGEHLLDVFGATASYIVVDLVNHLMCESVLFGVVLVLASVDLPARVQTDDLEL